MMLAGNVHLGQSPAFGETMTSERIQGINAAVVKSPDQHYIKDCASLASKTTMESSVSEHACAGLTTAECYRARFRGWAQGDGSTRGSSREKYVAQMIMTDPIVHQYPASRGSSMRSVTVLSGNWLDMVRMTAKSRSDLSSTSSLRKCSSTPSLGRRTMHVIPDGPEKEELKTGCQRAHYMHHNRSSPNLWRQLPKYAGKLSGTMIMNPEPCPRLRRSASSDRYQSQMFGSHPREAITMPNQVGSYGNPEQAPNGRSYRSLEQAPDGQPEGILHSWVASRYMHQHQYVTGPFFDTSAQQHTRSTPTNDQCAAVNGAHYAVGDKMGQHGADVSRKESQRVYRKPEPSKFEPPLRVLQRDTPAPRSTALETPNMQGSTLGNVIPENRRKIMRPHRPSATVDLSNTVHRVVSRLSLDQRSSFGSRLNSKSSSISIVQRAPWKF
eukprot:GEMP01031319.1.p1 GENE.GEMP01031319.1~~GEMP01031319.1.p1  ORF type:complete len:440 (+),score=66.65 GEMP01031319.1:182-1501(+)